MKLTFKSTDLVKEIALLNVSGPRPISLRYEENKIAGFP